MELVSTKSDSLNQLLQSQLTRVLDYGCGFGRFSAVIASIGIPTISITGVDVLPAAIAEYNEILPGAKALLIKSDWELEIFQGSKFDVLISYSVFSHLPLGLARDTLRKIFEISNPGAIFILTIWDENFLNYIFDAYFQSGNSLWLDSLRISFSDTSPNVLRKNGVEFRGNSGGDGLPFDIYGDIIYTQIFFAQLCESLGWVVEYMKHDSSVTLQTVVILRKKKK
jgi:SAM-dependent methyltransferase